jgi:arylsulfatase A-like enzyme
MVYMGQISKSKPFSIIDKKVAFLLIFVISLAIGFYFSANNVGETVKSSFPESQYEVKSGYGWENKAPENIIMIDMDVTRADHLGSYGYEKNTSPNIDQFARKNVKFENAVTPAPWTLPVAVSVFTGAYPRTHRVIEQRSQIPQQYTLLSEVLKSNGYSSAAFTGAGGSMDPNKGFERGFEIYRNNTRTEEKSYFERNFEMAEKWLENRSNESSFLFVHGYDMHDPYGVKEPYFEKFDEDSYSGPLEPYQTFKIRQLNYESGNLKLNQDNKTISLDKQDVQRIRSGYDSDLRHADKQFGEFMEGLREKGIYNDSLIVVYSSHGENLGNKVYRHEGEGHLFGHWYLWDHNINVPMIVKTPGGDTGTVEEPVSLIDIAPTLYEMTKSKMSKEAFNQLRGKSLLPLLKGDKSGEDYVFAEDNWLEDTMIRGEDWKLIVRPNSEDLLYSLDPEERKSIQENSRVYRRLLEKVKLWRNRTPESMEEEIETNRRNSGILSRLRSLDLFKSSSTQSLEDFLTEYKISVSDEDYLVKRIKSKTIGGNEVEEISAADGKTTIDIKLIKDVDSDFALEYLNQQRNNVISLYNGVAPYTSKPGVENCEEAYRPQVTRKNNLTVIELYADESKSYGACEEDAFYEVQIALGYCQSSDLLFNIADFTPISESPPTLNPECS